MQMSNIMEYLKEFIILGIFLIFIFLVGYFIIYKKIMKGTKTINRKKFLLYGISIVYMAIVFGATFLSRGNGYRSVNVHLFSSYREAWNNMADSVLQNIVLRNIILNILLFVPFGFILPIYSDKLKKIYKVLPIGFAVTLFIEIVQYASKMGIFEIDDIFNNTLGVLIGYCSFMIFNNALKRENRKYIFAYVIPYIVVIGTFLGIHLVYERQDVGNLTTNYNYKLDMKNVDVKSNVEFSNEKNMQNIYYTKVLTEKETRELAQSLFEKNGTSINENRTNIYENTALYYSNGENYHITIKYKGGAYSFATSSEFNLSRNLQKNQEEEVEKPTVVSNGPIVAEAIDNNELKKQGASREEVTEALSNIGITVPEDAEFSEKDGYYEFDIDMKLNDNILTDGFLICSYYIDGTVDKIQNNIVTYKKVMEKEVISKQDAYNKILDGKFNYPKKIESMTIEDVRLDYMIDTKGFYVPVYVFGVNINEKPTEVTIEALK